MVYGNKIRRIQPLNELVIYHSAALILSLRLIISFVRLLVPSKLHENCLFQSVIYFTLRQESDYSSCRAA